MNRDEQITDKQRLLDLLVDGELSNSERSELLAWCEREPDGWRRCALAFLEAQSWSSVLGSLADTPQRAAAEEPAPGTGQATGRRARGAEPLARPAAFWPPQVWNVRQWGTMLAMAAGVVLAFTLGLWVRDAGKAGQIVPLSAPPVNVVSNEERSSSDDMRVPGEVDGWSPVEAAAVPDDVRQALERLGHHVEQQRRWVPYRLNDGGRVVIPVDQVEVRPVEIQSYQ